MTYVRICAALIGLRSLTNFAKPFMGDEAVLVFFGQVLRGGTAALPAVAVGAFMLATAWAMWKPTKLGFPMIAAYTGFVVLNLSLWVMTNSKELERVGALIVPDADPSTQATYASLGMVGYAAIALATTAVPAWMLSRQSTD